MDAVMIEGKVTPPKDLTPAINALGEKSKKYLASLTEGREITPKDLALAADYDRDECGKFKNSDQPPKHDVGYHNDARK